MTEDGWSRITGRDLITFKGQTYVVPSGKNWTAVRLDPAMSLADELCRCADLVVDGQTSATRDAAELPPDEDEAA